MVFIEKGSLHPSDLLIYLNVLQRSCFEGFNSVGRSIIFIVHTTSQKGILQEIEINISKSSWKVPAGMGIRTPSLEGIQEVSYTYNKKRTTCLNNTIDTSEIG